EERLLRAIGDQYVLRRDQSVIILLRVADHCLLQRGQSIGRGVFYLATRESGSRGENGGDGSFVLGLADPQVDHGFPALTKQARLFVQGESRGFGNLTCEFTELHCCSLGSRSRDPAAQEGYTGPWVVLCDKIKSG